MALVSSLAVWFSNQNGSLILEWFGWQITTTPGLFLLALFSFLFLVYILFSFLKLLYNIPKHSILKIKNKKTKNALLALDRGIIASFYGNKKDVSKNVTIAKKTLKKSPMLLLLEFQDSLFKADDKKIFYLLTEMLEVEILKPIAIKSFISYSSKNNDKELFNNILNKSLDK